MEKKFIQGCEYFDRGDYFEAHEIWEDLWNEAHGARHAYLQCLIQVAVALHHAGNENWNGAIKLSASALNYLEKGREGGSEVDLDTLKNHILDFVLQIQEKLNGEMVELKYFKLPLREIK